MGENKVLETVQKAWSEEFRVDVEGGVDEEDAVWRLDVEFDEQDG